MVAGLIKNKGLFLLAALTGHLVGADKPTMSVSPLTFDKVSMERIITRQNYISNLLDEQASTRKKMVIGTSLAAAALVVGGGAYWYYHATSSVPQPGNRRRVRDFENAYFERRLAAYEEMQTVGGAIKHGLRNGFGYAIASVSTVALLSLFNKFGGLSWQVVKETFYPTTADLCATQEELFKRYFDYLQEALRELGYEQSMIDTPEQLQVFLQWREMLCADVQTSVSTMVRAVEDFSALAIEWMLRKSNELPQEKIPAQQFSMLAKKVDALGAAVNQLSAALEAVVNVEELAQLDRARGQVGMCFKHAVFTARDALSQLLSLVEAY